MEIKDYLLSNSKSWASEAAIATLEAHDTRPVEMDELQLVEIAEAHIAMKTDFAFDCAASFKQKLDDIRHTRWFRLLIMQTLVKKYNLKGIGV